MITSSPACNRTIFEWKLGHPVKVMDSCALVIVQSLNGNFLMSDILTIVFSLVIVQSLNGNIERQR